MARKPNKPGIRPAQSEKIPGPIARPYPFPFLWHPTMAQVMADEAREVAA